MLIFMMFEAPQWGSAVIYLLVGFFFLYVCVCKCMFVESYVHVCGLYVEVRSQLLLLLLRECLRSVAHQTRKVGSPEISRHLPVHLSLD